MKRTRRFDWVTTITILVCGAFLLACGVIGQDLKQQRLEHRSGTIPPVSYQR